MSEESVPVFDPTQKKKKKKPVKQEETSNPNPAAAAAAVEEKPEKKPVVEEKSIVEEEASLDFGKKKKKPQKPKPTEEPTTAIPVKTEDKQPQTTKATETQTPPPPTTSQQTPPIESSKQKQTSSESAPNPNPTSESTDPDHEYSYKELLTRMFDLLRKTNPDFGSRSQTIFLKPPLIGREGKKTLWYNFAEICTILHRKPEHMFAFVFAELGTSGSIDASQRLIIRGKYMPKHIETIIKKYIKEYVVCNTCNKLNTELKKENRLTFVVCTECHSSRSVSAIKKGFEAQVTKRKHDHDQ